MSDLFVRGNSKVKALIFNLPAIATCKPGKLQCHKYCYARKSERRFPNVVKARQRNFQKSMSRDFVSLMVKELKQKRATIVRLHASGDFYSKAYISKWYSIVNQCPNVSFYAYTKRDDLFKKLIKLKPNNLTLIYSLDGVDPSNCSIDLPFDKTAVVTSSKSNCPNQTDDKIKCMQDCKKCIDSKTKTIFFKKH
jgi:hypothetical protein